MFTSNSELLSTDGLMINNPDFLAQIIEKIDWTCLVEDSFIDLREQIRLCKANKFSDRLVFIQKRIEPFRYLINDDGCEYTNWRYFKIFLAELYFEMGDTKKLDRILLKF